MVLTPWSSPYTLGPTHSPGLTLTHAPYPFTPGSYLQPWPLPVAPPLDPHPIPLTPPHSPGSTPTHAPTLNPWPLSPAMVLTHGLHPLIPNWYSWPHPIPLAKPLPLASTPSLCTYPWPPCLPLVHTLSLGPQLNPWHPIHPWFHPCPCSYPKPLHTTVGSMFLSVWGQGWKSLGDGCL